MFNRKIDYSSGLISILSSLKPVSPTESKLGTQEKADIWKNQAQSLLTAIELLRKVTSTLTPEEIVHLIKQLYKDYNQGILKHIGAYDLALMHFTAADHYFLYSELGVNFWKEAISLIFPATEFYQKIDWGRFTQEDYLLLFKVPSFVPHEYCHRLGKLDQLEEQANFLNHLLFTTKITPAYHEAYLTEILAPYRLEHPELASLPNSFLVEIVK